MLQQCIGKSMTPNSLVILLRLKTHLLNQASFRRHMCIDYLDQLTEPRTTFTYYQRLPLDSTPMQEWAESTANPSVHNPQIIQMLDMVVKSVWHSYDKRK